MSGPDGADELFGAIEAGGTKFICAVGNAEGTLLESVRVETRDPRATLADVFEYFAAAERRHGPLRGYGVGAFGPLELRPQAAQFGFVTTTPKAGWQYFDLHGSLRRHFGRTVVLDTDVNAAALGEMRWGAGRHFKTLAYVTVGTGIGAGIVQHGLAVHGLMHPELGHVMVRRHPTDTIFAGICPFHGDCLEGLAAGPAIVARTGRSLLEARPDDPIWSIEADYLGQLAAVLVLTHSPERILFGGGVMQDHPRLFGRTHAGMLDWLRGYLPHPELADPSYIQPPGLGQQAGIYGALALILSATGNS